MHGMINFILRPGLLRSPRQKLLPKGINETSMKALHSMPFGGED